ncbi:HK97 gp10 family phage protein [Streptomyces sp. NPDC005953]|uniref:HK97 gp10 family phage protein n=1 Tax=Streptomyces sp. NPDC005953 TaxID=3156719 RepID=UPI0033E7073A
MIFEVEINDEAIALLPLTPEVQADFRERMKRVEEVAQMTAPVLTGEFQESIHLVETPDPDGTWHVDADAPHSYFVEHGTRQTDRNGRSIHPPRYTMSHALDAAGGDH